MKVSWDTTVLSSIVTRPWLWIHTPSPIHQLSPICRFQGNFTRTRGRTIMLAPMRAPNSRNAHTLRADEICRGLVISKDSTTIHSASTPRLLGRSKFPGPAADRSIGSCMHVPVVVLQAIHHAVRRELGLSQPPARTGQAFRQPWCV